MTRRELLKSTFLLPILLKFPKFTPDFDEYEMFKVPNFYAYEIIFKKNKKTVKTIIIGAFDLLLLSKKYKDEKILIKKIFRIYPEKNNYPWEKPY